MDVVVTFIVLLGVVGIWAPMDRWGKAAITACIGVLWVLRLTGTV